VVIIPGEALHHVDPYYRRRRSRGLLDRRTMTDMSAYHTMLACHKLADSTSAWHVRRTLASGMLVLERRIHHHDLMQHLCLTAAAAAAGAVEIGWICWTDGRRLPPGDSVSTTRSDVSLVLTNVSRTDIFDVNSALLTFVPFHGDRERKCADTIGTVVVPWAGHFQC